MNDLDPMVKALIALCDSEGGYKFVADEARVSPDNLWQIVNGTKLPSGNPRGIGPGLRAKITKAYPTWLDSASNMPLARVEPAQVAINSLALRPILAWEHPDDLPAGDYVLIPRLDVHLSAGNGCEQVALDLVKDTPQAFRAEWIREMRIKPAKLASMRANGDSMEPRIFDGDAVVVDTGDTTVLDGKVYAVWYDGGERIKRLYRLPGNGLRIASDNATLYPKIDLNEDQSHHVRVLGRVRHVSSTQGL